MRFKLDENLGESAVKALRRAGHDVETVSSEGVGGCDDTRLIDLSRSEQRCLVTLDKEFGSPLIYPPHEHSGIVLLRLPSRRGGDDLQAVVGTLIDAVCSIGPSGDLQGRLWIIQPGRVREYRSQDTEHE